MLILGDRFDFITVAKIVFQVERLDLIFLKFYKR